MKKLLHSFPPILGKDAKALILGSMPSVSSLQKQEYYGFAHNRFWKIVGQYFQINFETYEQKVACIRNHHLILWDVIGQCEREGSLDSNIKHEICNDIETLLKQHPSIHTVLCNGKKSYDLYQRHFHHVNVSCYVMPSTSNANRSIKEEELYRQWFDRLDQVMK